jgi:predicted nucleic acid-binding Zn ribbon protein
VSDVLQPLDAAVAAPAKRRRGLYSIYDQASLSFPVASVFFVSAFSAMNPLSRILEDTLRKLESNAGLEARAVMLWAEVVGLQLARVSEARAVQGGTLLVATRSSAWNQELSFQKATIIRRYRERLGKDVVKDVRFAVGKVRGAESAAAAPPPPDEEVRRIQLPPDEVARIREASDSEDPELSQAVRRALTHEAQLRQWQIRHGARICIRCGAAHRARRPLCPACSQDDATAHETL